MREDYAPGKPVIAGNSQAGSLAWEWSEGVWADTLRSVYRLN